MRRPVRDSGTLQIGKLYLAKLKNGSYIDLYMYVKEEQVMAKASVSQCISFKAKLK